MIKSKKIIIILMLIVSPILVYSLTKSKEKSFGVKMSVFHSKTCGCCLKWVTYLKENGLNVEAHAVEDMDSIKWKHHISDDLTSCHTALIDGYLIEGHVPVAAIKKLLKERPNVRGLSVPGMPTGSPGMEAGYSEKYDVMAFGEGEPTVFMSF